ncbi:unnamed protein product [Prorocentrum cordatum]|uniref:Uncharacterized protein n=2 Tax=Prorocentrum cordatum TaxID=2364126 RepID=A0ABN9QTM6_9DINO|nr:unnamed protein product [Polarella glacialis]
MGGEKGAGEEEEEEEEGEPNGRQRARADSEASPAAPRPGEGPGRIRVPPAGRRPERAELTWGARRGVPMREGSDRCLCGGAVDVQSACRELGQELCDGPGGGTRTSSSSGQALAGEGSARARARSIRPGARKDRRATASAQPRVDVHGQAPLRSCSGSAMPHFSSCGSSPSRPWPRRQRPGSSSRRGLAGELLSHRSPWRRLRGPSNAQDLAARPSVLDWR